MINVVPASYCFEQGDALSRVVVFQRVPSDGFEIATITIPAGQEGRLEERADTCRTILFINGPVTVSAGREESVVQALTAVEGDASLAMTVANRNPHAVRCVEVLSPLRRQSSGLRIAAVDVAQFAPQLGESYTAAAYNVQTLTDRKMGLSETRMFVARIEPNTGMERHIHAFDQFYVILEGTMALEVGIKKSHADIGDFVVLPAGAVHHNWNDTDTAILEVTILNPQPPEGTPLGFKVTGNF